MGQFRNRRHFWAIGSLGANAARSLTWDVGRKPAERHQPCVGTWLRFRIEWISHASKEGRSNGSASFDGADDFL